MPPAAVTAAQETQRWLRHESRIVGRGVAGLPLALLALFLAVATARALDGAWAQARTVVLWGLESGVPLAAGVGAAVAVTAERSMELQLSLGTPYRRTVLRRVGLVATAAAAAGLLGVLLLTAVGALPTPGAAAASALLWAAPLAWLLSAGAVLGLLAGRTAGIGLLVALWWAHHVLPLLLPGRAGLRPLWLLLTITQGRTVDWTLNRASLLLQAVLLALTARLLLARNDRLLQGDAT